jgi:hypothetical protein
MIDHHDEPRNKTIRVGCRRRCDGCQRADRRVSMLVIGFRERERSDAEDGAMTRSRAAARSPVMRETY